MKIFNLKKKNTPARLFCLLPILGCLSVNSLLGQVTIGSGIEPNKGSLLQLKENNDDSGNENSYKGFNFPRVNLTDKNNLYPMFLKDPKEPASGPSDEYAANKADIDKAHIGLVVYNVNITDAPRKGLYIWNGSYWEYSDGISPWYDVETHTSATENDHDIYLAGTVTIGREITESENQSGALLQLEEDVKGIKRLGMVSHNAYRGALLPRVKLSDKNELYPMFLTNRELPYDEASNPETDEYKNGKSSLKLSHTGLIVYNITDDDEKELCLGINQWDGGQWRCFEPKTGNAVAEPGNCDSLKITGRYQSGVSLAAGNYMTIPLHVTKAGSYTITATPDPGNGYYYTTSGIFLATGYYFLPVAGAGTPLNHTPAGDPGDLIKITFNGKVFDACGPEHVRIEDSSKKPLYTINCSRTQVYGLYKVDHPLSASENYIEVSLSAEAEAIGSTYVIRTGEVDGISFRGEGLITSTAQVVKLEGSGTPASIRDKVMVITSNSAKSRATCEASIVVTIPKKTVLTLGSAALYDVANPVSGGYKVLTGARAFGTSGNSVVASEGYRFISNTDVIPPVRDLAALLGAKPDIVVTGYDLYLPEEQAGLLAGYVKAGGVLLFYCEGNGGNGAGTVANLMRAIFGRTSITQSRMNDRGTIYTYTTVDDRIMNGPFGDLRGKHWGEDASQTCGLYNLPADQIDVYSYALSPSRASSADVMDAVVAFKHKTLNLLFVGDGGFISYAAGSVDTGAYPFGLDASTSLPVPRFRYGEGGTPSRNGTYAVYNSTFFANSMAWAIRQAEFNGINTP